MERSKFLENFRDICFARYHLSQYHPRCYIYQRWARAFSFLVRYRYSHFSKLTVAFHAILLFAITRCVALFALSLISLSRPSLSPLRFAKNFHPTNLLAIKSWRSTSVWCSFTCLSLAKGRGCKMFILKNFSYFI